MEAYFKEKGEIFIILVLFGFTGITEEMLAHWQSSLVLLARDAKGFASVCYDEYLWQNKFK